jgi:hypothetical protein
MNIEMDKENILVLQESTRTAPDHFAFHPQHLGNSLAKESHVARTPTKQYSHIEPNQAFIYN